MLRALGLLMVVTALAGCSQALAQEIAGEFAGNWGCEQRMGSEGPAVLAPSLQPLTWSIEFESDDEEDGPIDFLALGAALWSEATGPVEFFAMGPSGTEFQVTGSGTEQDPWYAIAEDPAFGTYEWGLRASQPVVVQRVSHVVMLQHGDVDDFRCTPVWPPI